MKKLVVKITNVNILVITPEQKIIDRIYSYNTIMELEEFEIVSFSKEIEIDCFLEIYNSINFSKCWLENGIIKLYCDVEKIICSSTIRSILFILADKKRQEKNIFTFHASAVEKNGRGIVFLGDSGSGKTSIALNLCLGLDFKFIANEYTLLENAENIYIKGIFSKINIRRSTLKNINNNFSANYFVNKKNTNIFFQKEKLNYDILPRLVGGQKVIADFFVIISIVEDVGSCDIVTDAYWLSKFLYSDASKFVTGNAMPLFYNDSLVSIYFPSIDNEFIFLNRINLIKEIIKNKKVYMIRGNSEYCTNRISELFD